MLRFFLGLTLAQITAAGLALLYPGAGVEKLIALAFLITLLSIVISLWFSTIARQLADKRVASLKERFAAERDKISKTAQRDKDKLVQKTQKQIEVEARRAKTKANIKVGGAIAVAAGFGVMMLLSQFVTLGLLTLTTAGGAVGGYLVRSRKEQEALDSPEYKLIEAEVVEDNDSTVLIEQQTQNNKDTGKDTGNNTGDDSNEGTTGNAQ
jgi:membrane protein implicated in regulation of membrane protease activity